MKAILLFANEDKGMKSRLDAALCLASNFEGPVDCVQITPYDAFIAGDPFGGVYALPTMVEHIAEEEQKHRDQVEIELRRERARWTWTNFEGHPGHILLERSRLSDIVVVSLPSEDKSDHVRYLAADLAIHARAPILAVPAQGKSLSCSGEAMIAWNGSAECAHALRFAVPLLCRATAVSIVTVSDGPVRVPASDAQHYLKQYGVESECHEINREGQSIAAALLEHAKQRGAHYLVTGAFGHSRFREVVLGGVTRELLTTSKIPLLLSH